jgi:nitroreductase
VIARRRMVRAFTSEPLDPAVVYRLLAAANRAPSAGFSQGYALLALSAPEQLARFWKVMREARRGTGAGGAASGGSVSGGTVDVGSASGATAGANTRGANTGGANTGGANTGGANTGGAVPAWEPVARAPLVVVPLSCKQAYLDRYARPDKGWEDRDEARWPAPYWDIDTGFTALLMLLAAVDEGLGALFFGIQPDNIGRFRAAFGVPEQYKPIGAVAIGHPDPASHSGGSSRVIKRRALADVVHHGHW